MKTYIKPTTIVVAITNHQMLCLSGVIDSTQSITNSSDFGVHQDNGWDIWDGNDDLDD